MSVHDISVCCTVVKLINCIADVLESKTNKRLPENTKQLKKESRDLLKEVSYKRVTMLILIYLVVDTIKVCKCEKKIINKY